MASTQAQIAKEKGNLAFKNGDFPAAIGHYTTAILADDKDFTLPLNRAAAYLKLGKHNDAERDCTAVLKLNASNVKALFRRGQARLETGKISEAQADLNQALKLEPNNDAVKQELKKAAEALEKSKVPPRKKAVSIATPPLDSGSAGPSTQPTEAPKRRRIPITIVEPPSSTPTMPTVQDDQLKPLKSRSLTQSESPTAATTSVAAPSASIPPTSATSSSSKPAAHGAAPKPSTFQEAKQARDASKPSRAGGGIFKSTGNYTLFEERVGTSVAASTKPADATPKSLLPAHDIPTSTAPPMTSFMFVRSWDSLKDPLKQWKLLTQIPPDSLPSMFQTSLEPHTLASILRTLGIVLRNFDQAEEVDAAQARKWIAGYVNALARTARFPTLAMFMSGAEKAAAREVVSDLVEHGIQIEGWGSL